jgi:hypothetical protein
MAPTSPQRPNAGGSGPEAPPRPPRRRRARLADVTASEAERVIFSTWREDELLNYVLATARTVGWKVYHTRYSIKSASGFPDVVAVSRTRRRVLYAELKREGLFPTESRFAPSGHWVVGQREWLKDLADAGAEVYLWWPSDTRDIATILTEGATPAMACVQRLAVYLSYDPLMEGRAP